MDKSKKRAYADALEVYWKVLGMAAQMKANELPEAKVWEKAAELLAPAVAAEKKRVDDERSRVIAFQQSQMPTGALQQSKEMDALRNRIAELEKK